MQPFREAAPRHHAAAEHVDDDDLVVADDVFLVELVQLVRVQRLVDVMHEGDVLGLVERALQNPHLRQQLLDVLVAGLGQVRRALLLVDLVIIGHEARDHLVDRIVEVGLVVGRAGDDERGARLVDEDRVHLVHHREIVPALYHLMQLVLHVVAQVVEAVLVVGAVGDVGTVALGALLVVEPVDDDAGGHAEKIVDSAHPLRVAAGEVVVHGDDVDAFALQSVEIDGERRHQRLALAGAHLGDATLVQHHAADELDVEMALAEHALGRLAHRRESRCEKVVERLAGGELLAEFDGAVRQLLVTEREHRGLERVDRGDLRPIGLEPPIVGGSEDLFGERTQHPVVDPSGLLLVRLACIPLSLPSRALHATHGRHRGGIKGRRGGAALHSGSRG